MISCPRKSFLFKNFILQPISMLPKRHREAPVKRHYKGYDYLIPMLLFTSSHEHFMSNDALHSARALKSHVGCSAPTQEQRDRIQN